MPVISFCGESFTVDHAVKGANYVHGYDANGVLIISLDNVTDFSGITYTGNYMSPGSCLAESCNDVKYCGGSLKKRDGTVLAAKDIGAAASGYGYGEALTSGGTIATEADLETYLVTVLEGMPTYTTKQIRANLSFLNINTFFLITVYKHTATYALFKFQTMRNYGIEFIKIYEAGVWGAIQYVNPPVVYGNEYRTTERYGGDPVYTQMVYCGLVTAAMWTGFDIPNIKKVIRYTASENYVDKAYSIVAPNPRTDVEVTTDTSGTSGNLNNVNVTITSTNEAQRHIYCQLWYTKEV